MFFKSCTNRKITSSNSFNRVHLSLIFNFCNSIRFILPNKKWKVKKKNIFVCLEIRSIAYLFWLSRKPQKLSFFVYEISLLYAFALLFGFNKQFWKQQKLLLNLINKRCYFCFLLFSVSNCKRNRRGEKETATLFVSSTKFSFIFISLQEMKLNACIFCDFIVIIIISFLSFTYLVELKHF